MSYRICVVCSGNICRSPMAAVILTRLVQEAGLADDVLVTSGGTGDWHVGDPADDRARASLRAAGYDGEAHRAAHFQRDWFAENHLILAADRTHVRALRTLAPDDDAAAKVRLLREFDAAAVAADDLEVDDPYYGSDAGFDDSLRVIERACRGVVEHVAGQVGRG